MPALICYTDPLRPGRCQMPSFIVGDDQNWSLQFSDGVNFYNPTGVTLAVGYIKGLPNATYASAFQLVDRMNNQHTGSMVLASGLPGTLTWDETPIGVFGDNGVWLVKGRVPPSSGIRKVYVKFGGTGISAAPAVRFNGGVSGVSGKGATATVSVSAGAVTNSFVVTNPGYGYSSTPFPEVIITGDGTGATAEVTTITGGQIITIGLGRGGSGYTTATVTIRDPEASATATVGGTSVVTGLMVANSGSSYTSAPTVAITGGGGASATATAALLNSTWGVSGLTVTGASSGYTVPPTLSFSGGSGSGVAGYTTIDPVGQVLKILVSAGNLYYPGALGTTVTPQWTVSFSGGGGSGAAGYAVADYFTNGNATITGIVITSAGTGYASAPTVTITQTVGSASVAATATATIGTGAITGAFLTNPGSGYGSTAPTVTVSSGAGTVTAQLIGSPISPVLTITNAGSGYTSVPAVGFSGGAGTGATATAQLALGVTAIAMVQTGFAYTTLPSLSLVPDNSAVLIPAGIEAHSAPFVQNFSPATAQGAITVTPVTTGRRDTSGSLIYDDALLIIRPRYILQPTLTLQADGLTWAGVFTPVTTFVNGLLGFQNSVTLDFEVWGGGRLLLQTKLMVVKA